MGVLYIASVACAWSKVDSNNSLDQDWSGLAMFKTRSGLQRDVPAARVGHRSDLACPASAVQQTVSYAGVRSV